MTLRERLIEWLEDEFSSAHMGGETYAELARIFGAHEVRVKQVVKRLVDDGLAAVGPEWRHEEAVAEGRAPVGRPPMAVYAPETGYAFLRRTRERRAMTDPKVRRAFDDIERKYGVRPNFSAW